MTIAGQYVINTDEQTNMIQKFASDSPGLECTDFH